MQFCRASLLGHSSTPQSNKQSNADFGTSQSFLKGRLAQKHSCRKLPVYLEEELILGYQESSEADLL